METYSTAPLLRLAVQNPIAHLRVCTLAAAAEQAADQSEASAAAAAAKRARAGPGGEAAVFRALEAAERRSARQPAGAGSCAAHTQTHTHTPRLTHTHRAVPRMQEMMVFRVMREIGGDGITAC